MTELLFLNFSAKEHFLNSTRKLIFNRKIKTISFTILCEFPLFLSSHSLLITVNGLLKIITNKKSLNLKKKN